MEPTKEVVKYIDGTVMKGSTQNFSPNRDWFYLTPVDKSSGGTIQVFVKRLNAIFIVRDFNGNPEYDERKKYVEGESPPGVKSEVTFTDGEVMVGLASLGYDPKRQGISIREIMTELPGKFSTYSCPQERH
jgi:hypothetical protein